MIDALFRKKANALQSICVGLCEKAYGAIGATTFFRCTNCSKIVIAEKIYKDGKCHCGNMRFRETNLTLMEEFYWIGRAIWKTKFAS